jgi:amicyanin
MIAAAIALATGRSTPSRVAVPIASAGVVAVDGVAGPVSVSIKDFAFDPPAVTVKAGAIVTWTNLDGEPHTVRTIGSTTVKSDTLGTNAVYSFTFASPGTYAYHCSIHPEMHGTIVVTK